MAYTEPGEAIMAAVRALLNTNATLQGVGVYHAQAPAGAEEPYIVYQVQVPFRSENVLGALGFKEASISVKAIAADQDGAGGTANASALSALAYVLLDNRGAARASATAALNASLAGTGWSAQTILETADVGPYVDYKGNLRRVHVGHKYRVGLCPA